MALTSASIPTIVSSGILETLKADLVYSNLFNDNYSGDCVPGNVVKIPSIGAVTTEAYTAYTDLTGQNAADTSVSMNIDKNRAFSITLDDIDAVMAKPAILAAYATEASYQLQVDVETALATELTNGTLVSGFGTSATPIEITSKNVTTQLRAMALALDNAFVPRKDRSIVLPPWACEKLTLASVVDSTNNTDALATGLVGMYAGFKIYMSPYVLNTASAKYRILAGSPISATFAMAVQKVEIIRDQKKFADNLRGLLVFGAKTTRPATVISAYWNLAAEA